MAALTSIKRSELITIEATTSLVAGLLPGVPVSILWNASQTEFGLSFPGYLVSHLELRYILAELRVTGITTGLNQAAAGKRVWVVDVQMFGL